MDEFEKQDEAILEEVKRYLADDPYQIVAGAIVRRHTEQVDRGNYWICGNGARHWRDQAVRLLRRYYRPSAVCAMAVYIRHDGGRSPDPTYGAWRSAHPELFAEDPSALLAGACRLPFRKPGLLYHGLADKLNRDGD